MESSFPRSRYALFFTLAACGCALDLLTKQWVFEWRGMPGATPTWWVWEGYAGIQTTTNPGALFGLGAGNSHLFAALSVVAALAVLYWLFVRGAAGDFWLTLALASVTGGILGNLYDRLGFWHPPGAPGDWRYEVRDWILLCWGDDYKWPNFNVADCLLVCGTALLMAHALWRRESPGQDAAQTQPAAASGDAPAAPAS